MKHLESKEVNIAELVLDFNIYPRHTISDSTARKYQEAYSLGAEFPPVRVEARSMRVVDGFHRVAACTRNKSDTIKAELYEFEDDKDLLFWAMAWNSTHGQNLSEVDYARCYLIGTKAGMKPELIAEALSVKITKLKHARQKGVADPKLRRAITHADSAIFKKPSRSDLVQPKIKEDEEQKKVNRIFESPTRQGAERKPDEPVIDWRERYERELEIRLALEKENEKLKEQVRRLKETVFRLSREINPDEPEFVPDEAEDAVL